VLDRLLAFITGRGRRPPPGGAIPAFTRIVAQTRQPAFYRDFGVPDTLDGRFEVLVLHVMLTINDLRRRGDLAQALASALFATMVDDFTISLREIGVGDSGLGRRMKTMVRGAAGRIQAYERALDQDDDRHLEVALDNNLYGTVRQTDPAHLAAMTSYVRRQAACLAGQPVDALLAGVVEFLPPPDAGEPVSPHIAGPLISPGERS
jgi:cytochrome b pre-mRNA-processing protein 3